MDILKRIENKAGSIQVKELPDDNLYLREKSYLEKIISEKEKELNELKLLKSAYENPLAEKEEIQDSLNSYLSLNERNYLHAKVLAAFTECEAAGEADTEKVAILYGKMINGPYKLEKVGNAYKFTLPHLISKYTAYKSISDGQAISRLVQYLMKKYEKETGHSLPLMEKCVIAFIHYVRKNQIPDPDNLDVKAVIDALKGKMIVEDDVLRVSLYHEGILSESLLTEVYILEKSDLCRSHFPVAVFGMF